MSNQDYISRTPPKKKKNNPYRKKPKTSAVPKSNIKTIFISLLILILIAGFVAGLWMLKTNPTTKTPIEAKQTTQTSKVEKALPKPPEEKWVYVDGLKTKVVEGGKYEVKSKGPYKMQCGSFKTRRQAESLKARMAFVGIESKIQTAQGKHNMWYKVVLGPYARKRIAEQNKHKLRNNKINGCQIWLWK